MMRMLYRNRWSIVAVGVFSLVLVAAVYAAPRSAEQDTGKLWLSHFVGDQVVVTFLTAPPNMGKAVKARLMDAEIPGIVLQFGKEEIFFSFSNISSVEPTPK